MSLSASDAARLTVYRAARDKLVMGQQAVRVSYSGFDTQFTAGDLPRIEAEIERLEAMDAGKNGRRRGALRFRV